METQLREGGEILILAWSNISKGVVFPSITEGKRGCKISYGEGKG